MADAANRYADEHEHATSGVKLASMLLIVVAIVVGVNRWAIGASPWRVRTHDGRITHTKWDIASKGHPPGGVIVVGDSSGNFAVVASELATAFERPAINLCTYGRFLVMGAGWFLDRAIERSEGTPSLVVVVLGSRTFALTADGYTLAQVPTALGSWSKRAPGVSLDPRQVGEAFVARVAPLFAQNRSFDRGIRKGMWAIDPSVLVIEDDGSSILPRPYPDSVAPFAEKTIGEIEAVSGSVPSTIDRRAIDGLVADAEARGYDLVFADGPIWNGLASNPKHVEFMAQVHAYIDGACAKSDRAHRLGGPLQTFDAAVMENPFHITREAGVGFTRELARRISDLGLPR